MIPIKLITKEEAEKNRWFGFSARKSPGILMAAGEDKKGIISVEQIDPETMEIIKKIKYKKNTKEKIFDFDRERDGEYKNFKNKNK